MTGVKKIIYSKYSKKFEEKTKEILSSFPKEVGGMEVEEVVVNKEEISPAKVALRVLLKVQKEDEKYSHDWILFFIKPSDNLLCPADAEVYTSGRGGKLQNGKEVLMEIMEWLTAPYFG